LEWTAPLEDNGSPVVSYQVYVGGVKTVLVPADESLQKLSMTYSEGVSTGNLYSFAVSAINERGESELSNPEVSIYAATVPSKVLAVAK